MIRESPNGDEVVVIFDGRETTLAGAIRDQWGVFVYVQGVCVAQEDGTRSFLDALIGALSELKRRNENTTAATVETA
ncbi:MAG: hypothetical protein O2856_04040 [Planctomycetota bacterium]|nr:hypothetical protein [Planctomycetota bacterium]